ncbi:hypothetical protein [Lewinella sp. IMCC34183]|uniref:hypothetical protein n=1 Tax=Lewinella sp. IMCC34183 TaxID=2248762 RepID=UPI000E25EB9A|nr:hypothetical protein [Lewinella sp. IMCC34183]
MRENPLPLLILFLAIASLPSWATARDTVDVDTVVATAPDLRPAPRRAVARHAYGPRYKNPLAAGRTLTRNREIRQAVTRNHRLRRLPRKRGQEGSSTFTSLRFHRHVTRRRAFGPAYKHRALRRRAGRG